jgi:hypothetical protein
MPDSNSEQTTDSNLQMISPSSIVVASSSQVFCDLGGEAAILSLANGMYYGLNAVGAFIWNRIQEPVSVEEICRIVVGEYGIDPALCREDVVRLLGELRDQELIEVRDAPASSVS